MREQEIRDGAPSGATHYRDYGGAIAYYKITPKHNFFWNYNYWAVSYRDLLSFSKPL